MLLESSVVRACAAVLVAVFAAPLCAQQFECAEPGIPPELVDVYGHCPVAPDPPADSEEQPGLSEHELEGRACYYADRFEGRRTASGEIFSQSALTAAHLTLPLGTWVEVTSLATGRKIHLKVNDRGPFSGGFVVDLSRSAAKFLGVDRAKDRRVKIKVVAMPGEKPPENKFSDGSRVRVGAE